MRNKQYSVPLYTVKLFPLTQTSRHYALKALLQKATNQDKNDTQSKEGQYIYYGVLEHYFELEEWLNQALLKKSLKPKQQRLLWVLLIGLYQIRYMNIPDHAAVSETVKLAKAPWEKKFINGCLRQACREPDFQAQSESARFNHPQWLIDKIRVAYPDRYEDILIANQLKAPNTYRLVNRTQWLQVHPEFNASVPPDCETAIVLPQSHNIESLPGYEAGEIFVQDIASQYVAKLLDLKPKQTVLDACSAPGGKACHIGQHEPQLDKLICIEVSEKRIARLNENLQRAKVNAEVICADAFQYPFSMQFDRILLDAPCSATGVIRRHPDIKLNRNIENILELNHTQLQLLSYLWQYVKPNGKLLYTTCSILPDENELIISQFLETQTDAIALQIEVPNCVQKNYGVQLLPSQKEKDSIHWGSDGFYYCVLEKESSTCNTDVKTRMK